MPAGDPPVRGRCFCRAQDTQWFCNCNGLFLSRTYVNRPEPARASLSLYDGMLFKAPGQLSFPTPFNSYHDKFSWVGEDIAQFSRNDGRYVWLREGDLSDAIHEFHGLFAPSERFTEAERAIRSPIVLIPERYLGEVVLDPEGIEHYFVKNGAGNVVRMVVDSYSETTLVQLWTEW